MVAQYGKDGGFGLKALERARAGGLTDDQIRKQLGGSGLKIGSKAAEALGANTDLYGLRGKQGQFGMQSYNNAVAAGMSPFQIRNSLAMSGLEIGDKAAEKLNINKGKTFMGYAPYHGGKTFGGNNGKQYSGRPVFAPRGYGLGEYGNEEGYSPTLYIHGGANDYQPLNAVFGTDYDGGPNIGGGYSDPDFHRSNYVPPANDPNRPFGGYPEGTMRPATSNMSGGSNSNINFGNTLTVGNRTDNSSLKIGTKKKTTTNVGGSSAFKRTNTSLTV